MIKPIQHLLHLLILQLIPSTSSNKTKNSPIATPDTIPLNPNELSYINVLENDVGEGLHIKEVTEAQNGYLAVLDGMKELFYAPDNDFEGVDSFEYTVCDSLDQCDTARVDLLVGSVATSNLGGGQSSQSQPQTLLVEKDELTQINIVDYNVGLNVDELFVKETTKPDHGSVALLSGKREILYVPDQNYEGADSFECTLCDSSGKCETIKIDILVGTNLFHCNTRTRNTVNFGYYQSWAIYRHGHCNPTWPLDIQVDKFGYTHLAFSFAGISASGELEPYNGNTEYVPLMQDLNALKSRHPELKTLIAVGGWSFQQSIFVEVAATEKMRDHFASSVVEFLETYGFDGIDLDWEYPVTRQGTPEDYDNYPLLCEAIRMAFNEAGHPDWLITVATSINPDKIKKGYDMVAMYPHIDFFNMMTYDIYGSWDSHAGANTDMEYITNSFNYIFELGVPREKLVFGMAAYGRSMGLSDTNCITNGCEVFGAGLMGCHGEAGNLPYFEIDQKYIQTGDYDSLTFNERTGSMELITGGNTQFTSYDSPMTMNIKYRYAFENCMRGIMWWAVDLITEPIEFYEHQPSAFPSLSITPTDQTTSPSSSPTASPSSPPTEIPPCGLHCPAGTLGLLPMIDCTGYYSCKTGEATKFTKCPSGTIFDEDLQSCNWPWAVTCKCTRDTVATDDSPSSSGTPKTPRPSPTPEKTCNKEKRNTVNFGYYQSWAAGRWTDCNPVQPGAIEVEAFGYTHLAFSFAGISWTGQLEPYDGDESFIPMYASFNSLKKTNPGLKTLIAVGGWTFPQKKFVSVSSTEEKRAKFALSVVRFLEAYDFDGIDLDWEYPVTRQGTPGDYNNYPLLCEAIRRAFNEAGHPDWLITVATTINPSKLEMGYDMVAMYPHIDFFNMMSYDIHGSWDPFAGANADLHYIKNTMHYVFGLGIPREKLVLGLAGYGRSVTLSDPTCITDRCPAKGAGLGGCHGEGGNLPFFEIDEKYIQTGNYDSLVMNETTASMELITHDGMYFTSYDSEETIQIKFRYAFGECFRGIMWWAVDLIKYPFDLLQYKPSVSPSVSIAPSTETRHPTTSPTIAPTVRCGSQCLPGANGFFPTMECSGYYECQNGALVGSVILCHGGLVFNEDNQQCDWSFNVNCQCTRARFPPTTAHPTTNIPTSTKPSSKPVTSRPSSSRPTESKIEQQSSSTNIPNQERDYYYPDYTHFTCRNDGQAPEFESNFFSTYDACCEFSWMDTEKCRANKPNEWYPVAGGYCIDDGNPPNTSNLPTSFTDCCTKFFASSLSDCLHKSKRWYPDYDNVHCRNDGQQPQNVAMSETYAVCCDRFMSSDLAQCYSDSKAFQTKGNSDMTQNSSSIDKPEKSVEYYPVPGGYCTNKGIPPTNIALSATSTLCCTRFFPSSKEDCMYQSNIQTSQFLDGFERTPCQLLQNKRQCSQDNSCMWDEVSSECSVKASTDSTLCELMPNKRQCKQYTYCIWNNAASTCHGNHFTARPTVKTTLRPTNISILTNELGICQSAKNKRQCIQEDSCHWDNEEGICSANRSAPSTSHTTPPSSPPKTTSRPTDQLAIANELRPCKPLKKKKCNQSSLCHWSDNAVSGGSCQDINGDMQLNLGTVCSNGSCLDFKGECLQEYSCLVDPCELHSCAHNQRCESNYCGGCSARCVENALE